jgi:hypothetical protein
MRAVTRLGFTSALALMLAVPAFADTLYNNLTPNGLIGIASRPDQAVFEIETADDFFLASQSLITSASFIGLIVPNTGATASVSAINAEIYRIFPLDSNTARVPNVVTRVNSPSDVAFDERESQSAELIFTTSVLSATFTVANSIQPGGVHALPNQTTGGNGPLTGQEVMFTLTFTTPFNLPNNHYFFVPQVAVNGGQFYWLSASRPISGAGTTPFPAGVTDLQVWTRDQFLDPDWSRAGMDIVGGANAPTFNAAFSLEGSAVPEPAGLETLATGLGLLIGLMRFRRYQRSAS